MSKMSLGELLIMMHAGKPNLSTNVINPVRRRMYNGHRYFRNIHAFRNNENSVLQVLGDNVKLIPVSVRLFKSNISEALANQGNPVSTLFHSHKTIVLNGDHVDYENACEFVHPAVAGKRVANTNIKADIRYYCDTEFKTATLKFTLDESQFIDQPESDFLVDMVNTRVLKEMVEPNYSNWNPLDDDRELILDTDVTAHVKHDNVRMLVINPTYITSSGKVDNGDKRKYSASLIAGVCPDMDACAEGTFLIASQSLALNKNHSSGIKYTITYTVRTFINPWRQHHVETVAIEVPLNAKLYG